MEKAIIENNVKMNLIERVKNLFICPKNLWQYIEGNPSISFPIITILTFNFFVIILKFSDFRNLIQSQIMEQAGDSRMDITYNIINGIAFFASIGSVFLLTVSILIVTIVFFAFIKVLHGNGTFKQCMSVIAYSSIINVIGLILLFIISIFTKDFKFSCNLNIFEILNIEMSNNFIYSIFNYVTISNLLGFWQHVLIAVGITQISNLNKKYVYIFTGLVYVVSYVLCNIL